MAECIHGNTTKEPCAVCDAAYYIDRRDLPAGTFIDTREGLKMAYGILWATWIDRSEKQSLAASMARELIRAELSQEECGEGITIMRTKFNNKGGYGYDKD